MDGPSQDIEGVELERDVTPEAVLGLDAEWVAWLEHEPIPPNVDGIDESLRSGGSAIA